MDIKISEASRRLGIRSDIFKDLEKKGVISIRRDRGGHMIFSERELREVEITLFDGYINGK